ncbi:MAG TPA: L-ribulose-5-phosphate 3-epimerase [Rectinemataceae bacterium]
MRPYRLGLYEKSMPAELPLKEKLEEAGRAGFDYLELSVDESEAKLARLDWTPSILAETRQIQADTGVPIVSICLSGHRRFPLGHPDPAVRTRGLQIMEKALGLASALGVRLIQIAGYDVYYEPASLSTRELFAEGLELSVQMAAREGVILAFETMETEFMDTVAKAMEWVEKVNSPYLQIYPDIGNMTNAAVKYGSDVLADLERGRGHIVALHLKETRPGIYRDLDFGSGHVGFRSAAAAALAQGVGLFVGEFWYAPGSDWRLALRRNGEFLRTALEAGL